MSPASSPTRVGMTSDGAEAVPGHVPPGTGQLAIVGASLIDATSPEPRPNKTVVVRDGRIVEVGDTDQVDVPADATVLAADDMFLLPGLWDMHVHQFDPSYLKVHLHNGVTGIRHMSGVPGHHEWRRQIADGTLLGPRSILASPIIDGPTPLRPGSVAVHDAASARDAVVDCHDAGAEFIKIYNLVPHDAFEAIANECSHRKIPFVGHLPLTIGIDEASDRGQASIEHLEGLLIGTSRRRDQLRQRVRQLQVRDLADMAPLHELNQQAASSHDPKLAADLYDQLATNRTWHTPTLAVLEAAVLVGTPESSLRSPTTCGT